MVNYILIVQYLSVCGCIAFLAIFFCRNFVFLLCVCSVLPFLNLSTHRASEVMLALRLLLHCVGCLLCNRRNRHLLEQFTMED